MCRDASPAGSGHVLLHQSPVRRSACEVSRTHGEAAEFDTGTPHAISADGPRPAQVISIFNDDGARIHTHLSAPVAEA